MNLQSSAICALALLVCTADLAAQRRRGAPGRGGMNQPSGDPAAAPAPVAMDRTKVKDWTVIEGADYVYLGTGQVMRFVSVLVGDDKIYGVGSPSDLEIPSQAKHLDVRGKTVAPGFVAVRCSGLGSPNSAAGKVADSVNPFDPMMKAGLAAGITSFLLTLDQGSATPDGKTALIKLAYGDLKGMVAREDLVLFMRVPLAPQQLNSFKDLVKKAEDHKKALAEHAAKKDGSPAPKPPTGTEKLLRVMQGETKLWVSFQGGRGSSSDVEEIRQALTISKMIGHGIVLYDPLSAWVVANEIAAHDCLAVVNPRRVVEPDPARPETTGSNLAQAKILADAGVPVAVTCPSSGFGGGPSIGTGGIMGQDLNTPHVDAAYAVRGGLDNRDALRTLCADSAAIIGVADRVGTIEVGKDADLLILDGDPLHYKTFVQVAIVNGKVVYEKDHEPFYQHVNR